MAVAFDAYIQWRYHDYSALSNLCEIALRVMSHDISDEKPMLIYVMIWNSVGQSP